MTKWKLIKNIREWIKQKLDNKREQKKIRRNRDERREEALYVVLDKRDDPQHFMEGVLIDTIHNSSNRTDKLSRRIVGLTIALVFLTLILLVITWEYTKLTKDMADIMNKEYRTHLDSFVQASHSSTLPTYPIQKESFWIYNLYHLPIQLLEYEFEWWHRGHPDMKFNLRKKDINRVIEPTTSCEEVIDIDLSSLGKFDISKTDIEGKIDFHLILKFRMGNEYFNKEIIRIF